MFSRTWEGLLCLTYTYARPASTAGVMSGWLRLGPLMLPYSSGSSPGPLCARGARGASPPAPAAGCLGRHGRARSGSWLSLPRRRRILPTTSARARRLAMEKMVFPIFSSTLASGSGDRSGPCWRPGLCTAARELISSAVFSGGEAPLGGGVWATPASLPSRELDDASALWLCDASSPPTPSVGLMPPASTSSASSDFPSRESPAERRGGFTERCPPFWLLES